MKSIGSYFASYSAYHRTTGNKITHYIGIPLIVFSTLGLLALAQFGPLNLGLVLWLVGSIFYCRLDWRCGLPFSAVMFAFYWFSLQVGWQIHLACFIVGWIFQGIGHYVYEKRSPAFITNMSHLLIGPFWIFCRVVRPSLVNRSA